MPQPPPTIYLCCSPITLYLGPPFSRVGRLEIEIRSRFYSLRKESNLGVARGLKSASDIKNKGLIGTAESRALIQSSAEAGFSAKCLADGTVLRGGEPERP
jgi:hypothetical protein